MIGRRVQYKCTMQLDACIEQSSITYSLRVLSGIVLKIVTAYYDMKKGGSRYELTEARTHVMS